MRYGLRVVSLKDGHTDLYDEKKETPCLVPYEELPEIEKAYDRNTAFNTLKYIVSLGFQISKWYEDI